MCIFSMLQQQTGPSGMCIYKQIHFAGFYHHSQPDLHSLLGCYKTASQENNFSEMDLL